MNQINIVIADDHQVSIEIMEQFIHELPGFEVIGTCNNGEELIEEVIIKKPDLVITDINMPRKNGVEAIRECVSFIHNLKFIFFTGYDEFAIEAFRLSAVDYIVKPIEKERLYVALEKAKKIIQIEEDQLMEHSSQEARANLPLREQNSVRYIPLSDIYFIEKAEKKCLVYTEGKIYETNEPISKLMEKLDESFYQAHRSYIINLHKVSHIAPRNESYIVHFENYQNQASISKLKINEVKERMTALIE